MTTSSPSAWLTTQLDEMDRALESLVRLPSFTHDRAGGQAHAARLEALFRIEGLTGERVSSATFADHLVFSSHGLQGSAPIALIGHSDTVFPPGSFEGYVREGGVRRGPGVLDMKGGLVVIAWALKAIAATVGLRAVPSVRVVVVSDEEVGSPEGAPLIRSRVDGCMAALVFESGRFNDAIVTQRKGTGSASVVAEGKPAHAGNNYFDGVNAIWALARYVDRVQSFSQAETGVTVNVGLISGGTSKNTVPAEARAELDLRAPTRAAHDLLWTRLRSATQELGVSGAMVRIEPGPGRAPMERTDATGPILERYAACARRYGLQADEAPRQGGGSDGNTTAAMGIPTLDGLGPRGRFFHTPEEYIEVQTLLSRAQALADFLLA